MTFKALLLLPLLAPLCFQTTEAYTELDPSNFDSFVKENEYSVVIFFAPWASTWEKFEDEFEMLEEELEKMDGRVSLALVDIEEHTVLSQHSGKNTIAVKFFWGAGVNGSNPPILYKDAYFAAHIVDWVDAIFSGMVDFMQLFPEGPAMVDEFTKVSFGGDGAAARATQPKLVNKARELLAAALKDSENVPSTKSQLIQRHLDVMQALTETTSNLSRNLHKLSTKLGTYGDRMKLQDYQDLAMLIRVYEEFADRLLNDQDKKTFRA